MAETELINHGRGLLGFGGSEFDEVDPVVDSGGADWVLSHFLMSSLSNFTG